MDDLHLTGEWLRHHRARSWLLVVTIAIAFFVYGMLGTLRYSLNGGEDDYARMRLIVTHQAGLNQPLPLALRDVIRSTPGVAEVGHATWFGAYYQTQKQMLMTFAVDGPTWLTQHPDMELTQEAASRFLATRNGMLVSEGIASKLAWQVGDTVPIKSILFQPRNGSEYWPMEVAGLFRSKQSAGGRNFIVTHYDYLNQGRTFWQDTVGSFMVTAQPGIDIDELAARLDEQSAATADRTSSVTDRAFHSAFFAQFGNVVLMIKLVVAAAFCSMLLLVASTLSLTVRQATREIGVLKVLGFSRRRILGIILGEAMMLIIGGGLLGLLLAGIANAVLSAWLATLLPDVTLPWRILGEACAIMIVTGLLTAGIPGLLALRMRPIEALSRDH